MWQRCWRECRPAVVVMIASAGVLILKGSLWNGAVTPGGTNWPLAALFALSFVLLRRTKWNPIAVMVLAGAMNFAIALVGKTLL